MVKKSRFYNDTQNAMALRWCLPVGIYFCSFFSQPLGKAFFFDLFQCLSVRSLIQFYSVLTKLFLGFFFVLVFEIKNAKWVPHLCRKFTTRYKNKGYTRSFSQIWWNKLCRFEESAWTSICICGISWLEVNGIIIFLIIIIFKFNIF